MILTKHSSGQILVQGSVYDERKGQLPNTYKRKLKAKQGDGHC